LTISYVEVPQHTCKLESCLVQRHRDQHRGSTCTRLSHLAIYLEHSKIQSMLLRNFTYEVPQP